ncbi:MULTISPECIES: LysR family transcriptional regulator [Burkholderia]|jgi:DNA-binding transcriptional LysR family regulator|uniref:LysR family transcriptional regulator n=6 Tax=Burkholderiaceae TaxID=119060 RepID=A0A1V2XXS3_9BURK|nr:MULTISPECIES: LysR family transcriptional regulator [Burkholderia]AIO44755.1 bacterial regulatory helix-turn-helix, lysR family protein [Burkholderia cepacia]ALV58207.1 LysR family transcriptional regulator [Burkholderia cenocepacia]AMU08611.1 LysR family transcriptional regulator [Burkholderia cenocepacia]AMU12645.1 LysR family transcriptional regulator [Burkholderia cenocepacia]AOK39183.1 LysR family transcriptional regulator [Burkholderia cenocepacia]
MKTTLDELQAFTAVVDTGSITAAAQQLDLTVSATSRTLARLEEKLKTTLLRRTTRRLELTEEGRAFLQDARAIIESVESAEEQMLARREMPSGRLRVDAATPFMLHVIVPLVRGYRERFPKVELELNSNEGITDLLERRTDVAIRIGRLKDSTLHSRRIGNSRVRMLASPAYLEAHGQPRKVEDLAKHTLLGFTQPESLNVWPILGADGEACRIEPDVYSSSGETLRQLALEGTGVVCLSDFVTARDREAGRLAQVLARQTLDVQQPIHAVYYRNTAISSRIASFVDYLIEVLGGGSGGDAPARRKAAWMVPQ